MSQSPASIQHRVEVVRRLDELLAYRSFWDGHAPSPLQSPQWLLAWWEAYQTPAAQLCAVVVKDLKGNVLGLAPFWFRHSWTEGAVLRFLGSGRACVDFQSLIVAPEHASVVGQAVGQWLTQQSNASSPSACVWSMLELEGVASSDAALEAMLGVLHAQRCHCQPAQLEHTWRLRLDQGWNGFLSAMSKTQRSQTRQLVNRFDKHSAWALRWVDRDDQQFASALATCMDLHQRRWQADGESGCFADGRFKHYVELACHELLPSGRVEIGILEDAGQPVAAHLCLIDAQRNRYMYQAGRDPARAAENFGRMLNALTIRRACQEGIGFIDFLRGDELYKHRLAATATPCLRLRVIPPTTIAKVRFQLRNGLKHLLQGWSNNPSPSQSDPSSVAHPSVEQIGGEQVTGGHQLVAPSQLHQ